MTHDLSYLEGGFVINDRYEIERSLGAGGFAVVYAGRDTQIDRSVAIKVMNTSGISKTEEAHAELVERFEREAKLAAKVEHPNVATIFDYGVVDGHEDPFIVMELMEGRDLEEQLAEQGPMAADRTVELMTETLVAVGLAHEAGIVHKDIKPSNLFLKNPGTRLETLSILDFGVAHITKAVQSRITRAGEMTGTPGYIPPEYARDQVVSPPLDVYQMALVLVEALTGEMVVAHSQPSSALLAHMEGELPLPVDYLESPLGPILRRALAADPEERYDDGLAFADDLGELSPEAIPPLGEEYETRYLTDDPKANSGLGERRSVEETRPMHGAASSSSSEESGGAEPSSAPSGASEEKGDGTQFMYGGPSDGGPSDPGEEVEPDDGTPEEPELENARTLAIEEGEEADESDGGEEVVLGRRFEDDDVDMSDDEWEAYPTEHRPGRTVAGGVAALVLTGGLIAYFAFDLGEMLSWRAPGTATVDEGAEWAGEAEDLEQRVAESERDQDDESENGEQPDETTGGNEPAQGAPSSATEQRDPPAAPAGGKPSPEPEESADAPPETLEEEASEEPAFEEESEDAPPEELPPEPSDEPENDRAESEPAPEPSEESEPREEEQEKQKGGEDEEVDVKLPSF